MITIPEYSKLYQTVQNFLLSRYQESDTVSYLLPSEMAVGCDLARYQSTFTPSIATGKIDFAIQKATEGATITDTQYDVIWNGLKDIAIRGAYHYQRSGVNWQSQADFFLNTTSRHDYHFHCLDMEGAGNTYSDAFFADTKRIIDYWRLQYPNKRTVLYTNISTYDLMYNSLIKQYGTGVKAWLDSLDFWIAYPSTAGIPRMSVNRTTGSQGKTWNLHQYSWTGLPSRWGTGGSAVDENVFNGTVADMKTWAGVVTPPSTLPPIDVEVNITTQGYQPLTMTGTQLPL